MIDFSNNARVESGARFALLLTDVYTREARAIPLGSKDPATVNAALGPALENLTDGRKDYVLTTDKGAEFRKPSRLCQNKPREEPKKARTISALSMPLPKP